MDTQETLQRAAQLLKAADAIIITAGAGMGVDSGLPDFRGDEGFWNAYPAYRHLGLAFSDMANPRWFEDNPSLAWGFYGHRLNLYRATTPHAGFDVLRRFANKMKHGAFVFTSNVDGAFQKAGFDPRQIVECHGSIHHVQCTAGCGVGILDAGGVQVKVDPKKFEAQGPLPKCPRCGELLRPNILMFGDPMWEYARADSQEQRMVEWTQDLADKQAAIVILEVGAGTHIPSVRAKSSFLSNRLNAPLVRINTRDPEGPHGTLSLPMKAKEALIELEVLSCT
jgi:NAD-dependent SIR2 family protein deacetylase